MLEALIGAGLLLWLGLTGVGVAYLWRSSGEDDPESEWRYSPENLEE